MIKYLPVDEIIQSYEDNISHVQDFLQKIYPIRDNGFNVTVENEIFNSKNPDFSVINRCEFLTDFYEKELLATNKEQRIIGVVSESWFAQHGTNPGVRGFACFDKKATIISTNSRSNAAHEIGHTFGLCDEYKNSTWVAQDEDSGCPNGDENNDNGLDSECLGSPNGCLVKTDKKVVYYLSGDGEINLYNMMGDWLYDNQRWISIISYKHILDKLKNPSNIATSPKSYLVSVTIYKNGTSIIDPLYSLENNTLLNESSTGNYSININKGTNIISSRNFTPDYFLHEIGGDTIELNFTIFTVVLPTIENVTSISLLKNGIIEKEVNVSLHIPSISINSVDTSEPLSTSFNLTWNASDLDDDNLYYAVLISPNNGSNYTTLVYDYTNTSYKINPNDFEYSDKYLFKILVTDGANTNYSFSNVFTMGALPASLSINSLQKIYSNNTLNIFEFVIQNNASTTINDISWTFDTNNSYIINSTSNISSLAVNEKVFVYIQHNFSTTGSYNVKANATGLSSSNVISSSLSSTVGVGDLAITNFYDINMAITNVIFEIQAKNNLENNITNVNWSLATGDGATINSTQQFSSIKPNETVFIFVNYDYGRSGTYSLTATVTNITYTDSKTLTLDVKHIEAYNLSVVNESSAKRIFEFVMKNSLNTNLTSVNWTFDTKNSNVINATANNILQPSEQMFVYIDYNFTTTGTFNVNATARNGTLSDSINLSITI